ncbi:glycosyltransferase [Candidatus Nephthysia bennettiae]|uniref:glycosyltransferase n=1 Tax=Candidatus Nephthysia bennettiae TaxID=3127016 RepID=UPI0030C66CD4
MRRRIRITYIVPGLAVGGAERSLVRLVNKLDRKRFEPTIICLDRGGPTMTEVTSDVRVKVLPLRAEGRHRVVRQVARLLLVVGQLTICRPHIVHGYLPGGYIMGALAGRLALVPIIVATRMTIAPIGDSPGTILRLIAGPANRAIDFHVCDSQAGRDVMIRTERISPTRSSVIHSGVEIPDLSGSKAKLPRYWQVDDPRMTAVCVANLRWQKAHWVLVEAIRHVVQEYPTFKLVLMGEGPERTQLEARVAELGLTANVTMVGSIAHAPELLPIFHLSVLASVQESFPNALVESMAAGVPVVATRVGGTPELVRDGTDGLLVAPADPKALADAMLALLSESALRDRMGMSARRRIEDCFSVENMVRQTEILYCNLLDAQVRRLR